MSKRRLVITAVLAGQPQLELARTYSVSQGWISKLMARYRDEGEADFEPRSRVPETNPTATPRETVELVLRLRKQLKEAGHDAGQGGARSAGSWSTRPALESSTTSSTKPPSSACDQES